MLSSVLITYLQVHIPIDSKTKQPKGLAYVSFAQATAALSAYEALDKKSFQGRLLHILGAVDRKGNIAVEEGEGKKKSLKGERNEQKKAAAGKEFNWSMLYMNVSSLSLVMAGFCGSGSYSPLYSERRCPIVRRRPHERL